MAVTFRAAGESPGANSTTCVIVKPVGLAVGDLMVAHIINKEATDPRAVTPPANWTTIREDTNATSTASLFWKIADQDDVDAINFTFTIAASSSNVGAITAWYGHDAATPINANSGQYNGRVSTITAPTITPSVANCMLLMLCSIEDNVTVNGYAITDDNPPSWDERYEVLANVIYDVAVAVGTAIRPETSATGNGTADLLGSDWNFGQLVAIAPLTAVDITVEVPLATSDGAGVAPTLSIGSTLLPLLATATATGFAPTILVVTLIAPPVATADGVGLVPTLSISSTLLPPTGTIDATGLTPTLSIGSTLLPLLATADGVALIPTLSIGSTLLPPAGTVDGAGLTPTLSIGSTLLPEVATADAAGVVPEVRMNIIIQVPVGTIDAEALIAIIITKWIELTLRVRSLAMTLQPRSLAMTLKPRSINLTLQPRSLSMTLKPRSLSMTLPKKRK